MHLALGLDGGGTHTRAIVVDDSGRIVRSSEAGPSGYGKADPEHARANIREAILRACEDLGPASIGSVFLGVAGVVSETDRNTVREVIADIGFSPSVRIGVDHDIRIALAAATGGAPGIVLIAGTGSSCYGRNASGESWRSGGWGFLLDDLGSAWYLGQQALVAIVRAYDGRGPATRLTEPVLEALEIADIQDLMRRIYYPQPDIGAIAALSPIVTRLAPYDPVAKEIIDVGCHELAAMVGATEKQLSFTDPYPLAAVGGVVDAATGVRIRLEAVIGHVSALARLQPMRMSPAAGAALLALEQMGVVPGEHVIGNLSHMHQVKDVSG